MNCSYIFDIQKNFEHVDIQKKLKKRWPRHFYNTKIKIYKREGILSLLRLTRSSRLVICSSRKSVPTLSSSTTQQIWSFLIPYPTATSFPAPQRSPSVSISRTWRSNSTISVSSSQGFTSRIMLDYFEIKNKILDSWAWVFQAENKGWDLFLTPKCFFLRLESRLNWAAWQNLSDFCSQEHFWKKS